MKLPASAESTPITYADAKGQQYVAVVATGGGLIGAPLLSDSVVAFSLTGESTDTLTESLAKPQSAAPAAKRMPPAPGRPPRPLA